jgi:hypothetical protein
MLLSHAGDSVMRILALAAVLAVLTASEAWAGQVQVPEPATLTMLALTIGGVGLLKLRRRK